MWYSKAHKLWGILFMRDRELETIIGMENLLLVVPIIFTLLF